MIYPTVRLGAVLKNRNPTVRVGAVFRNQESYGAVRCGSPLNGFCYGARPIPVRKTVQHRFLSTVHRMNKRTKTVVSYGCRAFSRGTNETAFSLL